MGFTGSVLNVKGGVGVCSTLLSDQRTGRRRTAQTEESERERERETGETPVSRDHRIAIEETVCSTGGVVIRTQSEGTNQRSLDLHLDSVSLLCE